MNMNKKTIFWIVLIVILAVLYVRNCAKCCQSCAGWTGKCSILKKVPIISNLGSKQCGLEYE